ncbi:family 43 glycosylhydrolase [Actinomadura barringtoniae]|uniref:Family 43 glycosylhydrolase n=1 Tax=Actinomadura barringtoniae TaxID=1427535 RepID=A0A939PQK8_9ACTN|nr:glycoside hydrolase family 43 protein [Actinomadura barringtoniae]MBO2454349.1 family 43 glycosylhydrolase [Actinomadura barringtoniae]
MRVSSRVAVPLAAAAVLASAGTAVAVTAGSDSKAQRTGAAGSADAATAAAAGSPKVVIGKNFADPEILKAGKTYYAYATNTGGKNLPVATAPSARGPWTLRSADGLPKLGAWARTGKTWAPDVSRRKDGKYLLYYAAANKTLKHQCIGVAVASSPLGPFQPAAKPLVCKDPTNAKAKAELIDPASYTEGNSRYLLYKVGYNGAKPWRPSYLVLHKVSADGQRLTKSYKVILRLKTEPYTVEAPDLVKRRGKYVLFYSAGVFSKDNYQTRYAIASKLGGPYTKGAKPMMTTAGFGGKIVGPGGADALYDGGAWRIVFHGAASLKPLKRVMYEADLRWTKGGVPYVR